MTTHPGLSPSWSQTAGQDSLDAWAHGLALRWGLIRTPEALTPQEAAQTILMEKSRMGWVPDLVYGGPSELHIGDLAQLAELMPYLTGVKPVPLLDPWNLRWNGRQEAGPITTGWQDKTQRLTRKTEGK